MKKYNYNNKTVLITGASSGIGLELTKILIEKYNAKVYGIGRDENKFQSFISSLDKKQNFEYILKDVSLKQSWEELIEFFNSSNIQIDCLINCAGIMSPFEKFTNSSIDDIEKIICTNLMSEIYGSYYFIPHLKKSKEPKLVNLSSASALSSIPGTSMYSATKSAILKFTEIIISENKDIHISVVMPGFTKTNIMRKMSLNENDKKLVYKFSLDSTKAANMIITKTSKKSRVIIGKDSIFLKIMYSLFPNFTPKFLLWIFKKSKLDLFKGLY